MESSWGPKKRTPNQEVFQETSSSSYSLSSNIYTNNKASKKDAPFKKVYKKGLTFLYTNADQFVNKRDDLIMFIANDSPYVILITEVIPKKQVNPITQALLNIDEYNCVLNFYPNDQNLGASGIRGVIIYSKKALEVIKVKFKIDGFQDHAWIEIPSKNGESILCGCIYRSPSYDSDSKKCLEITKKLSQLIRSAYHHNTNLLMVRDFNYKDIDWSNEYASLNFIETIQDCYLFQHVTEPTRFRENERSNILDLILSSEEGMVQYLTYHPPIGESDHVCLIFNVLHSNKTIGFTPVHNIYKTNYDAVREELSQHNWSQLLSSNFENDYNNFSNLLFSSMTKHSPMTIPPKKKKNIFMTTEAIRLKNRKQRLWRRFKTTKSRYDREIYIQCKNELRSLTRNLRTKFERNLATNLKGKPKTFWKYARSRLKTRQSIPSLLKPDGSKATSAKEKAETMNDFFSSVFTKENLQNIPAAPIKHVQDILTTIEITPEIVRTKLKALDPSKSPGHDKWHPHFLRELADNLCLPLSILLCKSLKQGAHTSWLKAVITPIYKKGARGIPTNYRPVNITSVISKIMESIVRDGIVDHLLRNRLLSDDQHGFVPGRNCVTQLLICLEEWTQMIANGESFDVIYTDFSKAFDSVAHERLMVKLDNIGVKGDLINWIRSFFKWEDSICERTGSGIEMEHRD